MSDRYFNGWPIMQEMPHGWSVDKTVGSPLFCHVFITNGKSLLNGQERALLPVGNAYINSAADKTTNLLVSNKNKSQLDALSYDEQIQNIGFRRTVNDMARERFKLNLLKDIMCDLTICEIEGWCKAEYIKQIKLMINEIGSRKTFSSY